MASMLLPSRLRIRQLLWVLFSLSLLSCEAPSTPESGAAEAAPVRPPEHSAPFDVSAIMRQVHFAYRPEGAAFRGGHSTYDVRASTDGLTLTPFAPPPEASSRARALQGAPLRVGALQLARGRAAPEEAAVPLRLEKGGVLARSRADVSEHLRNTEDGVQQEWVFPAAPPGEGALSLTVRVRGLAFTGASDQGLHFADPKTGLGFRYGHAAWVDAKGLRTPLQARYHAGTLQFHVPEALLASSTFPATLAPVITPELGTDRPVPTPQLATQEKPAVASNGTDYLVVWQDYRAASFFSIYGTRVTAGGEVLDDWGLGFSSGTSYQSQPAVASLGSDYLVVWEDTRQSNAIFGARVKSTGEVLDPSGVALSPNNGHSHYAPAVASNGTNYLVVWQDPNGNSVDIFGTRVTGAGAVLDRPSLTLTSAGGAQTVPSVASNGTDYLVVWQDGRSFSQDIYGTRVTGAGEVLDGSGLALSTDSAMQQTPEVASNGADYLVVWSDNRTGSTDVFGTRVTGAGVVVDATGLALCTAAEFQSLPDVASVGTDYLVVWEDGRNGNTDVFGTRVTGAGAVLDGSGLALVTQQGTQDVPVVTSNGTAYFLAWEGGYFGDDIFGTRVSTTGTVLDTPAVALSTAANPQTAPTVASNGTDYLVVWYDSRSGTEHIYGTRVSGAGVVLDEAGLILGTGPGAQITPAVASNGTDYFVVWSDSRRDGFNDIYGTRVTSAGAVLDGSGLLLSSLSAQASVSPDVASNGTDYLVVWQDLISDAPEVQGARVSSAGAVLDATPLAITTPAASVFGTPVVASNGTDYLVVWSDSRRGDTDIFGTRVTRAGAVLDGAGLAISTASDSQRNVSVASNGTDYLAVWQDYRRGNSADIFGSRISASGQVLDAAGLALSTATRIQKTPAVSSNGKEYLVVWDDTRSVLTDVYGARVSSTGFVREAAGVLIASNLQTEATPAVAHAGRGRTALVLYVRYERTAPEWSSRIRGHLVTFTDNEPPTTPVPRSPAAGARVGGGRVTFEWNASTDLDGDALTYELTLLQADSTTPLRTLTSPQPVLTLTESEALPLGGYVWRVRALDEQGASSASSSDSAFTVVEAPPAPDGGGADGGSGTDGGILPPPGPGGDSGCGCTPVPGALPGAPLVLVALGLLLRAARRR